MDFNYYMREALKEANRALLNGEVPIGAVIVHNGVIIGRGANNVENSKYAYEHAEIIAIKEASDFIGDWRLEDAIMFTTLEPCAMCAGAILNSRIKTVVVGTANNKCGFAGSMMNLFDYNISNHKVELISGILSDECSKIINDFFRKRRIENGGI